MCCDLSPPFGKRQHEITPRSHAPRGNALPRRSASPIGCLAEVVSAKDGMSIEDAVVDAGAVRFRPMALTAAAVIVGSAVILFDPIFQGLAISLMAGEVASLLLSRMTVPITYYLTHRMNQGVSS